eukprot:8728535-Pyramimonas_sp.AAC.1
MDSHITALHGCAYGLKDRKGDFMKKPWTIASTSDIAASGLERKCDGTHARVEARGKDCKLAEDST